MPLARPLQNYRIFNKSKKAEHKMTKENSNNKVTITVAIITSVTSICVAVVTGIFGLQAVQMQRESEATSSAVQVIATQGGETQIALEGTAYAPTSTPYPTHTLLPTYTAYPTHTPYPTLDFTPTPALVLNLPFSDTMSDGTAPEWGITGKSAIVDSYLRNTEADKRLVLELNSNFPQTYTISVDYTGLRYFNSFGDFNVTFLITIGQRFRCYIRNGNNNTSWQSFENNQWIDIPGSMNIEAESGNLKFNVFNNTYQLFSNGQIVGTITYGEVLPGPISISIGDNIGVSKIELTSP